MKQTFKCRECGNEFEIEADYFIPGVSGQLVDRGGVLRKFVDPTNDKLCDVCVYFSLRESFAGIVGDEKAKEILAEHDQRLQVLIEQKLGEDCQNGCEMHD